MHVSIRVSVMDGVRGFLDAEMHVLKYVVMKTTRLTLFSIKVYVSERFTINCGRIFNVLVWININISLKTCNIQVH